MQLHYNKQNVSEHLQCFHCGEDCADASIYFNEKNFCCEGCKLVFELLDEKNLCTYYSLNSAPGIHQKNIIPAERFLYLDEPSVARKLIHFSDENESRIIFYIPKMHCSSCIWLLENFQKINSGINSSTVNFLKKEVLISFKNDSIHLSSIVSLLANIGYEPLISLNDLEKKKEKKTNKSEIIKIGIAGFCFGNIMMLSFPEYFSLGNFYDQKNLKQFFGMTNLVLSLPVFFYSASDFFISAWKGIRQKFLNIDLPIAFAIIVTFLRSIYEISSGTGAGYLDSMTGIIFFMLIGRYFQNITYDNLSFDRDYKSYFPISVSVLINNKEKSIPVSNLKKGDRIFVRNNEIIPADSILESESTHIDYSFVTGESRPIKKLRGELVYAGGRQLQGAVELETVKEVSQSYLTGLWNKGSDSSKESQSFIHVTSKYFTIALFTIAVISFLYWTAASDINRGLNALTAVLIVACPCALLLSATFTNGNLLRVFGKNKFYVKNALVAEKLTTINAIVFDKTGTITHGSSVKFIGKNLTDEQKSIVSTLTLNSLHPLSRKIAEHFSNIENCKIDNFKEIQGHGIQGTVEGKYAILGSEYYVTGCRNIVSVTTSNVFFSLDGLVLGYFSIDVSYREGIIDLIRDLDKTYEIHLISGDNDSEKEFLKKIIHNEKQLHFDQSPEEKLGYIKLLQEQGKKVIMLGDGLNDAGALLQSDIGISVSDDVNNFSPSCDAILQGESFYKLKMFLDFSKSGKNVIMASFIMSILYNIVGISFSVQGNLSPVIAAILMPVSSISIVLLTTLSTSFLAFKKGL